MKYILPLLFLSACATKTLQTPKPIVEFSLNDASPIGCGEAHIKECNGYVVQKGTACFCMPQKCAYMYDNGEVKETTCYHAR